MGTKRAPSRLCYPLTSPSARREAWITDRALHAHTTSWGKEGEHLSGLTLFFIVVAFAAAGILKLWIQQRRERGNVSSIDGFRTSLERLSTPEPADGMWSPDPMAEERRVDIPRMGARTGPARPESQSSPLTPERRAAAKRRIADRRRAARSRADH